MWVPGKLPPNFVFLVAITEPLTSGVSFLRAVTSDTRHAVAADAADEAAHLQDADGREDAVDG